MLIGHVRWIGPLANVWCSNLSEFSEKSTQLGLLADGRWPWHVSEYVAREKYRIRPIFLYIENPGNLCRDVRQLMAPEENECSKLECSNVQKKCKAL